MAHTEGPDIHTQRTLVGKGDSWNAWSDRFAQVLLAARICRLWEDPEVVLVVALTTLVGGMVGHTEMFDGHRRPFNGKDNL